MWVSRRALVVTVMCTLGLLGVLVLVGWSGTDTATTIRSFAVLRGAIGDSGSSHGTAPAHGSDEVKRASGVNGSDDFTVHVLVRTVKRVGTGWAYLNETLEGFADVLPECPFVHVNVLNILHNDTAFGKRADVLKEGTASTDLRHMVARVQGGSAYDLPSPVATGPIRAKPIWRPVSMYNKQMNLDVLQVMRLGMELCAAGRQDRTYIMLAEDDMRPCKSLFCPDMRLIRDFLVSKTPPPVWVRVGTGGHGVMIRCQDLPIFKVYLHEYVERGPHDSLLSLLAVHGVPMSQHFGNRRHATYRFALFDHLGKQRTQGQEYSSALWVPSCRQMLNSAGLLEEEYFKRGCKQFSPCDEDATSDTLSHLHPKR